MNTERTSEHEAISDDEVGAELVRAVAGAGAAWARYGLTLASASLDASARSLQATAGLLGLISERITQRFDQIRDRGAS
jgi:hypothetical protein